jgi:cation diffusion facilitator family transporter
MKKTESQKSAQPITLMGAAVNVLLIALKFIMGILGNSQALIADAVHSVSDLFTDIVVLFGLHRGSKPPDDRHPFGHGRIETLATSLVGMVLIGTALLLGIRSAVNIYNHSVYYPSALAILGASLSIFAKEALYHFTIYTGRRMKNSLVIANAWHHRSDALSSVAVLVGVAIAYFNPAWHLMDAYAALLVSFFIIKVGLEILAKAIHELSDAAPDSEIIQQIESCALKVDGVTDIHDLRVRTSGGKIQLEIHVVVDGKQTVVEGHRIAKKVEACLLDDIDGLAAAIIHIDPMEDEPPSNTNEL